LLIVNENHFHYTIPPVSKPGQEIIQPCWIPVFPASSIRFYFDTAILGSIYSWFIPAGSPELMGIRPTLVSIQDPKLSQI